MREKGSNVLCNAGQWGVPTVTGPGVVGMLAAVFASIIESIGDYYTCAKVVGKRTHAYTRPVTTSGFMLYKNIEIITITNSYNKN